jgi:RNA polymerase sigma factor (sigma-70 family)
MCRDIGDEADRALLVRLVEGDPGAFWLLWQQHARELFAVCLRELGGNRADAEDAFGQAMLKARGRLMVCGCAIVKPAAWLKRTTSNECKDILRRRARIARHEVPLLDAGAGPFDDAVAALASTRTLIESLPSSAREVVEARFIEELTYEEIARRLEISVAVARKRVQRARSAMRTAGRDGGAAIRLQRPASAAPRQKPEAYRYIVDAQLPSGAHAEVALLLAEKPRRVSQKITTLQSYLERHPGGWKMRLKLADLLYASGAWAQAVDQYREVLRKRPGLAAALRRLAAITELEAQLENVTKSGAKSSVE